MRKGKVVAVVISPVSELREVREAVVNNNHTAWARGEIRERKQTAGHVERAQRADRSWKPHIGLGRIPHLATLSSILASWSSLNPVPPMLFPGASQPDHHPHPAPSSLSLSGLRFSERPSEGVLFPDFLRFRPLFRTNCSSGPPGLELA